MKKRLKFVMAALCAALLCGWHAFTRPITEAAVAERYGEYKALFEK